MPLLLPLASNMKAMLLVKPGSLLVLSEVANPLPGAGEVRLKVEACAICRTDLHIIDGELDKPKLPLILGHEIVGLIDAVGSGVDPSRIGRRVGVAWLGQTCGTCEYCRSGRENLCDHAIYTGYTRDGGFASYTVADERFSFDLDRKADPVSLAPLMCAGLIGWRCLKKAGNGRRIGIYGFGAAAHIISQIIRWQGREFYAFTRPGDQIAQQFARQYGATWTGSSETLPPEPLDAAIIFAPVGNLVRMALRAVRKGGRVVCGGIHMSDIPVMPYSILWGEREIVSVANLTRKDAAEFFPIARSAGVVTHTSSYSLDCANEAVADIRAGRVSGAAVLIP